MSRARIPLPESYHFECEIPVLISDINYGGHLSNDAVLKIAHEARLQMLKKYNYNEKDIGGCGLIMSDAVVLYKSQAFHGDILRIVVAFSEWSLYGFELTYKITNSKNNGEIARIKTGMVCFDYANNKLTVLPADFKLKMSGI